MTHSRQISPRRRKGQKGGNIVESALVMMTMVAMIIFIMDMGRILLTEQFISERVRTAVRSAVVNNWSSDDVKNFVCYNSTTAPAQQNGANVPGYMGILPSQVSYTTLGSAGTPDYRLQVTVSGVPVFTWIPYISGSYAAPPIKATMPAQGLGATS